MEVFSPIGEVDWVGNVRDGSCLPGSCLPAEVISPRPVTVWGVVVPERQLSDGVEDDEELYPELEEKIDEW